jgi:hypothetical protein
VISVVEPGRPALLTLRRVFTPLHKKSARGSFFYIVSPAGLLRAEISESC